MAPGADQAIVIADELRERLFVCQNCLLMKPLDVCAVMEKRRHEREKEEEAKEKEAEKS
jgi:hypothetical protein